MTSIQQLQPPAPIAIVGIGCRYPGGADTPGAFWDLIRNGVDSITEVPASRWDVDSIYDPDPAAPNKLNTRWGGFLKGIDRFDPQFFGIAPREVAAMDPQQRLLLEVAWEALEDGGQVPERLRGSKTGVFVGISTHDYSIMLWQQPVNNPYGTTGTGNCIAANRISYLFDFKGPSLAIDTACSSSLVAVHLACQSLWNGESHLALAGGVNVLLLPTVTAGFSKGGFMSGCGRCQSFAAAADGYVRSEGAGMVVLKPLTRALADGDPIYAVIRGSAVNQDGSGRGLAAPNPEAQAAVLREAYARAGVDPACVSYIEAHGTGTPLGDPVEARALGAVLAVGRAPEEACTIGSVKSNIGHTEAAAGVAGLIKAALMLDRREIPPSLHSCPPNPAIDFAGLQLRVQTELAPLHPCPPATVPAPLYLGVNSFGFGGTNAHVVLSDLAGIAAVPPAAAPAPATGRPPMGLLVLSAKTSSALKELARRYDALLAGLPESDFAAVCAAASRRRSHFARRLACTAGSVGELRARLQDWIAGRECPEAISGAGDGAPQLAGGVAFLFPGQGSQFAGMGRELYDTQPIFRDALDRCAAILARHDVRILEAIYPKGSAAEADRIHRTAWAQPALLAVEYALAQLWLAWGIRPSSLLGHSIGEYAAACIAGVFDLEDALMLVAERGRLMEALPPGAMLAVRMEAARLQPLLAPWEGEIALAACNGPLSTTISGSIEAIEAIAAVLASKDMACTRLQVSHAFHSPLMDGMLADFRRAAASVTYRVPTVPFISTLTGTFVSAEIATPDYWVRQVRQPVRFAEAIAALLADETQTNGGEPVFLEVGAKPILCGLGPSCLPTAEARWLPSLRPDRSDWASLLPSLGALYVRGAAIDWDAVAPVPAPGRSGARVSLPTYPFQRQRHWWEEAIVPSMNPSPQGAPLPVAGLQTGHPLLGDRLPLAGTQERRFQVRLSLQAPAYLADHCILATPILPGAAYVEMAIAAGLRWQNATTGTLTAVALENPLIFAEQEAVVLQLVLVPGEGGTAEIQIFSFPEADADRATRHATATIASAARPTDAPALEELQALLCDTPVAVADYYQLLGERGLTYGASFQGIQQLWQGDGCALSRLRLPDGVAGDRSYHLHPVLLDACFQTIGAATGGTAGTYLPVGLERLQIYHPLQQSGWCGVRLQPTNSNGSAPKTLTADVFLWNEAGEMAACIAGMELRYLSQEVLPQLLGISREDPPADRWLHDLVWQPQPASLPPQPPRTWLVFADSQGVGASLMAELQRCGDRCIAIAAGETYEPMGADTASLNPAAPAEFERLLADALPELAAEATPTTLWVIYLWGLDASETDLGSVAAQQQGCGGLLHLVQAVARFPALTLELLLVTQATQTIDAPVTPRLQQLPLWGLARTLRLEQPSWGCLSVDLPRSLTPDTLTLAIDDLRSPSGSEDQIAYRQGTRFVARLLPHGASAAPRQLSIPPGKPFRLGLTDYGMLDRLELLPSQRRSPAVGEVEIQVKAAGLNFRDVLNALGMLAAVLREKGFTSPTEVPFGGECAGIVTAVGAGVAHLRVGDAVIAAQAVGGIRQFVTVRADFVATKPPQMSFAEAATIPTTFLTAYYGLVCLAGIQKGDRVAIHAAAGGVGQAAVQIARYYGAEVFATASPAKWDVLRAMGVEHIANSRTLEFADATLAATDGAGVDIVFNSLNGDTIPQSLKMLASGGRFVEIGKIGIWDAERMQRSRPDVAYFPFDLLEVSEARPETIATMLAELMSRFAAGDLQPLPKTVFPVESAPDAFRYMAQARHIGKVVLKVPTTPARPFRPDATYLIAGGLGALGMHLARWLAAQGARSLLLLGRRSPSAETQAAIGELERSGVTVRTVRADIANISALAAACEPWLAAEASEPLGGVFHLAGVLDDGLLVQQDWERCAAVLQPKLAGAWNLHQLTQHLDLDYFVCFSSMASLLGSSGQGSYAAANAFLDGLAQYRHSLGLSALSLNWGPWAEAGMAARLDDRTQTRFAARGLTAIAPETGLRLLGQLLSQTTPQVGVLPIHWPTFIAYGRDAGLKMPLLEAIERAQQTTNGAVPAAPNGLRQLVGSAAGDRSASMADYLRAELAKVMGYGSPAAIEPTEPFSDLGMDSLMAVEFGNRLQANLGQPIAKTLVFDYPTIDALAAYLAETLTLESPPQSAAPPPPTPVPAISPAPAYSPPPEHCTFALMPDYLRLRQELDRAKATDSNPFFTVHGGTAAATTEIGGRSLLNFASYNYLGLSGEPRVAAAAQAAIERYGTSVSASRLVSGERPVHRELERAIAAFLGTEDCIAYIGGHATNVTTIGHLFQEKDLILYDALSHNSIREGCRLSGATAMEFPHNDWQALDRLLQEHRRHYEKVLVAIEGIYSADGDLALLPEFVRVKTQHKAFLLVDEAHSIGVLGARGRGIGEHFGIAARDVDLWMGTLSKSFASCGGYIAGEFALVEYLKYTAPGFVFSVGMTPANAAAALAALEILEAEPERVAVLQERSRLLLSLAREGGLDTGNSHDSPVVPIIVGESDRAVRLSQVLAQQGINVQPMVYPSVPYNGARLRFFVSCLHTEAQIRQTVRVLADELQVLKAASLA